MQIEHSISYGSESFADSGTIELALNRRESFRAEICLINGRQVVRLSRWKLTPAGSKRTGPAFEFGAHRCEAVANLLNQIGRGLGGLHHAAT